MSSRLGPILGIGLAGVVVVAIAVTTLRGGNHSTVGSRPSDSPATTAIVPTSTPTSATPTMAQRPTVSPDGWLPLTQIAGFGGVLWTPDSSAVAILDPSNDSIGLFGRDGSALDTLYGYGFVWIDNSRYILTRTTGSSEVLASEGELGKAGLSQIPGAYLALSGAGHGAVALTMSSGQGYVVWGPGGLSQVRSGYPLAWSPDGSLIAVAGSSGVEVVRSADGTEVRSFPSVAVYAHTDVLFSPDSTHIAVVYDDLQIGNIATGKVETIGPANVRSAAWLTKETLLVQRTGSDRFRVVTQSGAETQDSSGLMTTDGSFATAPSAKAIAVAGSTSIEVLRGNAAPRTYQLPAANGVPFWSPDGTRLVVVCLDDASPQVVLITP